mgnify:CR=1 FL=1
MQKLPVTLRVTEADEARQSYPTVTFPQFNQVQLRTILAQAAKVNKPLNEYSSQSDSGRYGRYQMNAAQLESIGYLKQGTVAKYTDTSQAVNAEYNWTGMDSCHSISEWLSAESVQEQAVQQLWVLNHNYLVNATTWYTQLTADEQAGYLMVSQVADLESTQTMYNLITKHGAASDILVGNYWLSSYWKAGFDASQFGVMLSQV